jgi:hypothetical protein
MKQHAGGCWPGDRPDPGTGAADQVEALKRLREILEKNGLSSESLFQ